MTATYANRLAAARQMCRGQPDGRLGAHLALRLVRCTRCTRTVVRPPADEHDRCDACGRRGVEAFTPIAVQLGPTIVTGDICADCAAGLGVGGAT